MQSTDTIAVILAHLNFSSLVQAERACKTWYLAAQKSVWKALYLNTIEMYDQQKETRAKHAKKHNEFYFTMDVVELEYDDEPERKRHHRLQLVNSWIAIASIPVPRNAKCALQLLERLVRVQNAPFPPNMTKFATPAMLPMTTIANSSDLITQVSSCHMVCAMARSSGIISVVDLSMQQVLCEIATENLRISTMYLFSVAKDVKQCMVKYKGKQIVHLSCYRLYVGFKNSEVALYQIIDTKQADNVYHTDVIRLAEFEVPRGHVRHICYEPDTQLLFVALSNKILVMNCDTQKILACIGQQSSDTNVQHLTDNQLLDDSTNICDIIVQNVSFYQTRATKFDHVLSIVYMTESCTVVADMAIVDTKFTYTLLRTSQLNHYVINYEPIRLVTYGMASLHLHKSTKTLVRHDIFAKTSNKIPYTKLQDDTTANVTASNSDYSYISEKSIHYVAGWSSDKVIIIPFSSLKKNLSIASVQNCKFSNSSSPKPTWRCFYSHHGIPLFCIEMDANSDELQSKVHCIRIGFS